MQAPPWAFPVSCQRRALELSISRCAALRTKPYRRSLKFQPPGPIIANAACAPQAGSFRCRKNTKAVELWARAGSPRRESTLSLPFFSTAPFLQRCGARANQNERPGCPGRSYLRMIQDAGHGDCRIELAHIRPQTVDCRSIGQRGTSKYHSSRGCWPIVFLVTRKTGLKLIRWRRSYRNPRAMKKISPPLPRSAKPRSAKRTRHTAPPGVNPRLGAQTRKVLQQHYRAKHGVK